MARYFAYADDSTAGGTTLEVLGATAIPQPTERVPVTSANAEPGTDTLDRNSLVTGRRAQSAPQAFRAAPSMTFETLAFPKLAAKMLRAALSGAIASTGTVPAAVESTFGPLQTGNLKALIGWLVREGQADAMTGLVVDELAFDFPADAEGTLSATLRGLYHQVDTPVALGAPASVAAAGPYLDAYMLRDVTAYVGAAETQIDCLGGFGFTFNNGLIDEPRSRYCAGKNVETTVLDGIRHKLWFPDRNPYAGQAVTGRLDFGTTRPDQELRRILAHADKLVVELAAAPLGTTPAADEMMRLTFYKTVLTGGGAEPLQRDGDQMSSYEFSAYLDETTDKDLEVTVTSTAALV